MSWSRTGAASDRLTGTFGANDAYFGLPDGSHSFRVKGRVGTWEDDHRRECALSLLERMEGDVRAGQRQLLLRRSDFARHHDAEMLEGLFEALEGATRA